MLMLLMLLEFMLMKQQQQQQRDHSGGDFFGVSDDMWTPRISSGDSGGLGREATVGLIDGDGVVEEDLHHHVCIQQLESPGVQIGCNFSSWGAVFRQLGELQARQP